MLLKFLSDHITKGADFHARYKWSEGDVCVWDQVSGIPWLGNGRTTSVNHSYSGFSSTRPFWTTWSIAATSSASLHWLAYPPRPSTLHPRMRTCTPSRLLQL